MPTTPSACVPVCSKIHFSAQAKKKKRCLSKRKCSHFHAAKPHIDALFNWLPDRIANVNAFVVPYSLSPSLSLSLAPTKGIRMFDVLCGLSLASCGIIPHYNLHAVAAQTRSAVHTFLVCRCSLNFLLAAHPSAVFVLPVAFAIFVISFALIS